MDFKYCRTLAFCALAAGLVAFSGCGGAGSGASAPSSAPASSALQESAPSSAPPQAGSSGSAPSSSLPAQQLTNAVPQSAKADPSYFDDAVFIGDSVSLKLKNYVIAKRKTQPGILGKARFLAAGSMGSANALKPLSATSIHPAYNGSKALLEDNVAAMGAKKVYIMLGANDVALYGTEGSVGNMAQLLANIRAKSPDAAIFVQSATPMLKQKQMKQLNNPNLLAYDVALSKMCKEKGYHFVDVASVLRDTEGNLPPEYCSDPNDLGIHFTDKACEIWINYLLTHTVQS